jgi:thioredoxin
MEKLIDVETEKQLKEKFVQEMKNPVDVKLFTNMILLPGQEEVKEINDFARQILKELSSIEPRILVKEFPVTDKLAVELGIKTSPSIVIGYDLGYKIIFNGAPLGHEATSLIETILLVSSGESHLEDNIKEYLKNISKDVHLQVFVTPTCPYCPMAVITANQFAIELKGKVKSECVESAENEQLAIRFNVSSVPQTVINGILESSIVGAVPAVNLVKQILKFAGSEEYKIKLQEEEKMKKEKEKLIENPMEVIYLTENNFNDALKKYGNLVVDFWAEWCMPCKMLAPTIEQLSIENKGKIVFGKLNVDENPKIASDFEVMSIPTLIVFKQGNKVGQIVGVQSKTDLQNQINNMLTEVK